MSRRVFARAARTFSVASICGFLLGLGDGLSHVKQDDRRT
jgi:hypothetical protein